MKISAEYQATLAAKKGQTIKKETYSVKLMTPIALQYLTGSSSLTVDIELFSEGTNWWRPKAYIGIYLESPLHWDNSLSPMPTNESEEIIMRIGEALRELGWRYRFLARTAPEDHS